jgi:hypothetical protein
MMRLISEPNAKALAASTGSEMTFNPKPRGASVWRITGFIAALAPKTRIIFIVRLPFFG